ncbi:beta-galactosidase [Neobacillus bataviensis]|uniref:Beta-galactosidase n=1 Tax=Neobacillus bataviensis TaxID=220685 RepID=A0A561DP76_9BACI|nr:beta-galactosidase [Neobacillus bataviensis]TWE05163.1 beta-galactosidase [Neobacillus bataviensis]
MDKSLKSNTFALGACYYPEHWPESLWEKDFRRMKEIGFSVVRLAEFAWSIFEPKEGEFSFDFFDRVIDLAHSFGIQVILGTPTATPPAWLTSKYPEVLNVSQEGVPYQHGQRRHYNYNAPIYLELCARIATKMAEHYKDHPAVIGWQIDNELNCEMNVFYSEADHQAFRSWLKNKYGSLTELNQLWGTVFWNQSYTEWSQVHLTRPTVSDSPNPHQALDEKRFFSDSAIAFAKNQVDIIRKLAPNQWITTNGLFGHLDSHKLADECLDFISYDSYPQFSSIYPDKGPNPLLDRKWSWNLSVARSISSNFCIMEQQSGPGGWVNRMDMPAPKPGQLRLWTYQSIAHGVDMLLYFRWRTAAFGTEIYWHGIHNYDNRKNRRVLEAEQVGKELEMIGEEIVGSKYQADVAIVKDYDNEWDGELDRWYGPFNSQSEMAWFKVLQRRHIPVDALFLTKSSTVEDLLKYKLLVYPHSAVMPEEKANLLKDYVNRGGKIVFGCRTGYKDNSGHCYLTPMPGPVAELCGVIVDDFTMIGPNEAPPKISILGVEEHQEIIAESFNDILHVESDQTEVLGTYKNAYYDGQPALVKNTFGNGDVYYYGAVFNQEIVNLLVDRMQINSPASDLLKLPEDVELSIRKHMDTEKALIYLLNYSKDPKEITLKKPIKEKLTGQTLNGNITMEGYGVMILEG